jgi:uncharacterized protein YqhQ
MGKVSRFQLPRIGGIALRNGVVLVSDRHWAAAVRNAAGDISVASGRKPRVPRSGWGIRRARGGLRAREKNRQTDRAVAGSEGIPLLRGLGRFGESLLVLGQVKIQLPQAELPLEGGRVVGALAGAAGATSFVKALAPKSPLIQETGLALAAFVPAVLALRHSPISGYHGAEHKVIGGRETALGSASAEKTSQSLRPGSSSESRSVVSTDIRVDGEGRSAPVPLLAAGKSCSAAAAKEHDRCGSNLVGPYLLATVATNLLARAGSGRKSPAASAIAGAVSLGAALEALRWATRNGDSILARLLLLPGRTIQRFLTTSEPTAEQLEVGERALAELLRLEGVSR